MAGAAHADLVQRAVRWLRSHHRCSIVYAEIVTGAPETPDAIGWRMGFSRLVEVKKRPKSRKPARTNPAGSQPAVETTTS